MRYLFFIIFSFSYIFADAHIFIYHRFGDNRYPSTNTSTKELIKQFNYLKQHHYQVVPLEKIITKLQNKKNIPSKWIALTIDDGFKSFYKNGFKIFKQYHYPFSLYVYVEATNKHYGDYMNWDQIKEVSKYGTIGLHSYSHPELPNLSSQEILQDTQKAYRIFVNKLAIKPTSYAYPYGEYNKKVTKILKNNFNFNAILNQNIGSVNKNTDRYNIPRIALVGKVNIVHQLRYKTFSVKWYEPTKFPKDGILRRVHAKVDPKYKTLKLYVTKNGWRDVKVKNGIVDLKLNIHLKKARTRIMLGSDIFTVSANLLDKIKTNKGEKNDK